MAISLRFLSSFALVLACCLAGVRIAAGAEGELTGTLKKINDTGIVTIGYREDALPFSYVSGKQPIGYSIDLCHEIVDDIGRAVGRSDLAVRYKPVTAESRIPAVVAGEGGLGCGCTTPPVERRQEGGCSPPTYLSGTKHTAPRRPPPRAPPPPAPR